jgi:hypothetical protein
MDGAFRFSMYAAPDRKSEKKQAIFWLKQRLAN